MRIKEAINNLKEKFSKWAFDIASHIFLSLMIAFVVVLAVTALVFYIYVLAPQNRGIEISDKSLILKEELYNELLKIWEKHEEDFQKADQKEYLNPFKSPVPKEPEEELTE